MSMPVILSLVERPMLAGRWHWQLTAPPLDTGRAPVRGALTELEQTVASPGSAMPGRAGG